VIGKECKLWVLFFLDLMAMMVRKWVSFTFFLADQGQASYWHDGLFVASRTRKSFWLYESFYGWEFG
jgi:hypothetical protein